MEGSADGKFVGNSVGFLDVFAVGSFDGKTLGFGEGSSVGLEVGLTDGSIVGSMLGPNVGWDEGASVGETDGTSEGVTEGAFVGLKLMDGAIDGSNVGCDDVVVLTDGDSVGLQVTPCRPGYFRQSLLVLLRYFLKARTFREPRIVLVALPTPIK